MNIPADEFTSALYDVYRRDPCGVLPNALWKTLRELYDSNLTTSVQTLRGRVMRLEAVSESHHMLYWDALQTLPDLPQHGALTFALVHNHYLHLYPPSLNREAYFRMKCPGSSPQPALPGRFRFRQVSGESEANAAAALITRCYSGMILSGEQITGWMKNPVYEPSLWVWIEDRRNGIPAALGIADYDQTVPEVSLEWIQVLPEYRRMGLGRAVVQALLHIASDLADIITVSGRRDPASDAEALYRACGFTGDDIWWVLRRP